jgi:Cell wall-associated hydrolases (invasion-associated proteins)
MGRLITVISIFLFTSLFSIRAQQPTDLRDSLVHYAHKFLKTPYRSGGSTPRAFDCSGFSSFVYKHFGYNLYRSSGDQVKNGIAVEREALKPGDLVLFKGRNSKRNRIGHVGIVVEADEHTFKFIHASVRSGVIVNSSEQPYYKKRYVSARRILPDERTAKKEEFILSLLPASTPNTDPFYFSTEEMIKQVLTDLDFR